MFFEVPLSGPFIERVRAVVPEPDAQNSLNHWVQSMETQMAEQREHLRAIAPPQIAERSGASWTPQGPHAGTLALTFLQQPLSVRVPDYLVVGPGDHEAPTMIQGLVLTYLLAATGVQRAGEWVAFRELPGGMFYHQAFTGYTGGLLSRTLDNDLDAFKRGAQAVGGTHLTALGDAAYEFHALPGIWLAVTYWLGDDEDGFPPQARVLFDRSASDYMTIDGLAIIGSHLVRRILSHAGREAS
jgi:hypothetical protein